MLHLETNRLHQMHMSKLHMHIPCGKSIVIFQWQGYLLYLSLLWILHHMQLLFDVAPFIPMAMSRNCNT